ncbi:hypothetical protein [Enterocloster citroniae]|uniref:Holin n=2 Tax=Enterocloster citroniae TaxID=358743 RepID=A0ABV2G3U7_9FIRM|nr:hypothetical protein [Enterocloster citroniae]KMW12575.1 hypothetical protein HMPREF9470_05300 [[Clostridium] citroniae WAL-19142]MCC3398122.1 zinc-ribbon domain-containing protein [Clostridiales bacterium AHG0011]
MKSIKLGGSIVGIFMICFDLFWTFMATQASPIMALFGVLWTGVDLVNTIYQFKNAIGKNSYSAYDITDATEESDPLNEMLGAEGGSTTAPGGGQCFMPLLRY